ncbi:AAA family ATPase [Vibrio cholerae]|uniref:AAA family ATPase n=1 Tax=Vibrio cholerae TaxID=666 RepID=UPI003D33CED1
MTKIYDETRNWLLSRPDWQQEAAERLLSGTYLSEEDINQLADYAQTVEGQTSSNHRMFASLGVDQYANTQLFLTGISDVYGMENLKDGTSITFHNHALTLVFGPNGAGKSTYTRILRKASGAPNAKNLKPNVFEDAPDKQACVLHYNKSGSAFSIEWMSNAMPLTDLAPLDVFDSDVASNYLTQSTSSPITPRLVAFFEELASVTDRVKNCILQKIAILEITSKLPPIPPQFISTQIANHLKSLESKSDDTAVANIFSWSKAHQTELNAIVARLNTANPAEAAQQKRALRQEVLKLHTMLSTIQRSYNAEVLTEIRRLRLAAVNARRAASEATRFTTSNFPEVGSETWHAMWEAARAYSVSVRPGHAFPMTNPGDYCVLCHQPLTMDAASRLQEFERFVQGKLETAAKGAEKEYQDTLNRLPNFPEPNQAVTLCRAAGLETQEWQGYLRGILDLCQSNKAALRAHECSSLATDPNAKETIQKLSNYITQLDNEATQLDRDAAGFDRTAAVRYRTELEARHWASQILPSVFVELARVRQISDLKVISDVIGTREISIRSGVVGAQLITQAYIERFNTELVLLNAAHIRVELEKKNDKGKISHRIRLKNANGNYALDSVLSEGERRIVALAAFIANVLGRPQVSPFIFDDPISSLDHKYEEAVAARLTALAQERQVIVLTHRLSLIGAFDESADALGQDWKNKNFHQQSIAAFNGKAGIPLDVECWATNVGTSIDLLQKRLNQATELGQSSPNIYYQLAQGICSEYRKLLERCVEDVLLSGVVKRHRQSVTTQNKLQLLSAIDMEDCQFLDEKMSKFSHFEHSQSLERAGAVPEPDVMKCHLNDLRVWIAAFKRKLKELKPQ